MNFRKAFLMTVLLLAAVLPASAGFPQDKAEKVISFSGLIQTAAKDSTFIVVNEVKVVVSGATIVNDNGNILGASDLKPKLYVTVDAVRRPDGFLARKVTVISSSKMPKNIQKAL